MLTHSILSALLPFLVASAIGQTAPVADPPVGGGDPDPDDGPQSIEDLGRALLEEIPEDATFANDDLAETAEDDPPAVPSPAEAATDLGEPIVREEDGAEWNEDAQRWQLDGRFVAGEAPAEAIVPTPPAPKAKADAAPAGEPKAVKVVLPGIADRGEEDIEVEVDAEIADRIRRLRNDGARAKDYAARRADLETREAQLAAYQDELEVDPIGFHLNKMPADQQLAVARALLVEHLDQLIPDIARLEDPAERLRAVREMRDNLTQSSTRLAQTRQVRAHASACVRAAEALIPAGTDPETFTTFLDDARRELARAAEAGQHITPELVPQILAKRVALYGFSKQSRSRAPARTAAPARPAAAPARSVPSAPPAARPVTDRARAVAARGAAPADAAAAQARIRRTQAARSSAARVAPVGAGAAPVQTPALPPEAEVDIASVSRHLRRQGLPESWNTRE